MPVMVSIGKKNINRTLHHILDVFTANLDYSRGIFIKPNIVFPVKAKSKEITSPTLVKALITTLRERQPNIDIVIGEGVAAGCDPSENFRVSGFADLARELNVPLLDLHNEERIPFHWKFGKLELPRVALERAYINLPILKPSSACIISGALKNQKGLLKPEEKKRFHRLGLHEQIAELNIKIQPALTIMDCSSFFKPYVLLAGDNCGEIDATACDYLDIEEPEHILLARSIGVFTSGYQILGDDTGIKQIAVRPTSEEYKMLGRLRLWSNPQACTMCRYLFHDIKRNLFRPDQLSTTKKLIAYSVTGTEIIIGSNPRWHKEYPNVLCIGECTRRIAKEGGYIHIPGCPPTLDDLKKNLP